MHVLNFKSKVEYFGVEKNVPCHLSQNLRSRPSTLAWKSACRRGNLAVSKSAYCSSNLVVYSRSFLKTLA